MTEPVPFTRDHAVYQPQPWMEFGTCRSVDPNLFFPDPSDYTQVKKAKAVCAVCPVINECREYALPDASLSGTWGGMSERDRMTARRAIEKQPAPHGTRRGYEAHLKTKTPVCQECREAKNAYERKYKKRREVAA